MRKKLKLKKNRKLKVKYLLFILLAFLSYKIVTINYISPAFDMKDTQLLDILLNEGNHRIETDIDKKRVITKIVDLLSGIDISSPATISKNTLLKVVTIEDDGIITNMQYEDDYSNLGELEKDFGYIEDPNPIEVTDPVVYIYNTHQLENYNASNLEPYNIKPTVQMASYILKEKLIAKNISTLVEEADITEFLRINSWNYSASYKASRVFIENAKEQNPSIVYFIDIHRDSIRKEASTATLSSKAYAKTMFVVGLDHDNYEPNLILAKELHKRIEEFYPGISRGVLTKKGKGVNGIYNQNLSENAILIEIGGVDNTIDEVNNSVEMFAEILTEYIGDQNDSR